MGRARDAGAGDASHVETTPSVVILAGPNGAGKSTAAPTLLRGALGVTEFVNADAIARGLSAFAPERAALAAGRVMRTRLRALAAARESFAFETTLASRSFAPWLHDLAASGYAVHLVFLWLPSAHLAVDRVAARVRDGGHDVPSDVVRRRYRAGLRNFFRIYAPIVATWRLYDGAGPKPRLLAMRLDAGQPRVYDEDIWLSATRGSE
jgi:predicted ABC-type ATPase